MPRNRRNNLAGSNNLCVSRSYCYTDDTNKKSCSFKDSRKMKQIMNILKDFIILSAFDRARVTRIMLKMINPYFNFTFDYMTRSGNIRYSLKTSDRFAMSGLLKSAVHYYANGILGAIIELRQSFLKAAKEISSSESTARRLGNDKSFHLSSTPLSNLRRFKLQTDDV